MAVATTSQDPKFADALKRGLEHFAKKEMREATVVFREIIQEQPDHVQANFQIARILLEKFWSRESIPWFKYTVERAPTMPQAWQGWAEAVALGGSDDDRTEFLSALKKAKLDKKLVTHLQDRFGARSKGSRPQTGGVEASAVNGLLKSLSAGQFSVTESLARNILAKSPKSAVVVAVLANALVKQKKFDEAERAFRHAIKIDPLYAEAYGSFGRMLAEQSRIHPAMSALRPAVILAPDMVAALVELAMTLLTAGHQSAARILIERASRLDTKSPELLIELAKSQLGLGEYRRALSVLERAKELYGSDVPGGFYVVWAQVNEGMGRNEEALSALDLVSETDENYELVLSTKANILKIEGDFDQAEKLVRQALELNPLQGGHYGSMVVGRKVQANDPIIPEMKAVFERNELSAESRMNVGFALSKALEDAEIDGEVFKYLNAASDIAKSRTKMSREDAFKWFEKCFEYFSSLDLSTIPAATENEKAPIFVTGLPRSGTTLVEQIIAAHSRVEAGGELSFGDPMARQLMADRPGHNEYALYPEDVVEIGRSYSNRVTERFPNAERITDKSITTFQYLGLMKLALPNANFVVVRRDPRANLFSMYKNRFSKESHGYTYDLESLARYYDEFDKMIAFWRDRIPGEFYEVQYEDLVSNPEEEAPKLIEACGLDWEDQCLEFHKKKNTVKTLSVFQVRQPISTASVKGWRRFEDDLQPMIEQLRKDGHVTD